MNINASQAGFQGGPTGFSSGFWGAGGPSPTIASKCGDGVFEAAQEAGFYAIGVDSDQKYIAPEVIVCSMRKEVGDSIYYAVKEYMAKGDECGLFGTTWVADMATGYVGLAYGEAGSIQQVSAELKVEVEELVRKIISGEIKVDTTR